MSACIPVERGNVTESMHFAVELIVYSIFSLQDVLMQDSRLYLVFEFLSMDLKKYLDSIPSGQYLERSRVKVMRTIS